MTQKRDRPRALLVHRGELGDVRTLLAELDVDVYERAGVVRPEEASHKWDLVVCTGPLAPDLNLGSSVRPPPCIAVVADDARTLQARLRRSGVQLVVRRPFHPSALRLLILRALYRGPERRRNPRVTVGAPVKFERGLRRRPATLIDLSQEGCRVETHERLRPGERLVLVIPRAVSAGRRLALKAEVAQKLPATEGTPQAILHFRELSNRHAARLADIIARYGDGPPVLHEDHAESRTERRGERRRNPRHSFARRVIALGDEAARVLVGRDLSVGGMRVEPNASLRVGEKLRLAIHGGDGTPAVMEAEVVRDEGDSGYVLRFVGVGERERSYLEALLSDLPTLSDPRSESGDLVVSERLP